MMLNIDLPDWIEGKELFIMAGMETVAHKHIGKEWMVKTSRCSSCGACCENLPIKGVDGEKGVCNYLVSVDGKRICELGICRPFFCCVVPCKLPECTQSYEACG
jgi:hypothetical protein